VDIVAIPCACKTPRPGSGTAWTPLRCMECGRALATTDYERGVRDGYQEATRQMRLATRELRQEHRT
jgi:hypothetical protein